MNQNAAIEEAVVAPELTTRTRTLETHSEADWLCSWCLNRVACEKDGFSFGGNSNFAFMNPGGITFQIITFSEAIWCRDEGVPSLEHTWFSGYAWSYCHCEQCRMHLGWFYSGSGTFVGLIRDRIVRATLVR